MNNEAILGVLTNLCGEARNSAQAIFGVTELHRNAAADSTVQARLDIVTRSSERLLRSLDDLRELLSSAPAAGELEEEFDLAGCLSETVELLNLAAGQKTIRLEAAPEPLILRQDRQAVEQVLTRTLDAATTLNGASDLLVAAREGSGKSGVRFRITPEDSCVAVSLAEWLNADPGQAGTQNAGEAHLGLALMVAGRRLRALGGTAELVRNSGEPAHVVIDVRSRPDGIGTLECPVGRHKMKAGAVNILLAEDCDDSYALTELLLRNENVWRARNGWEAIDIAKKRRFDVVFMDVHMPGVDGYATIRAIREWETLTANARTPIVILSSDDLETQHRSAAQSGCSGFLRKPLREHDLQHLLARLRTTPALVS